MPATTSSRSGSLPVASERDLGHCTVTPTPGGVGSPAQGVWRWGAAGPPPGESGDDVVRVARNRQPGGTLARIASDVEIRR